VKRSPQSCTEFWNEGVESLEVSDCGKFFCERAFAKIANDCRVPPQDDANFIPLVTNCYQTVVFEHGDVRRSLSRRGGPAADDASPEITEAQLAEVRRRIAQVESGEVALIPGDEALARVRRLLGDHYVELANG
jgi:hypothetical protein